MADKCSCCWDSRIYSFTSDFSEVIPCVSNKHAKCTNCGGAHWYDGTIVKCKGCNLKEDITPYIETLREFYLHSRYVELRSGVRLDPSTVIHISSFFIELQTAGIIYHPSPVLAPLPATLIDISSYEVDLDKYKWVQESCNYCLGTGIKGWPETSGKLIPCHLCWHGRHLGADHFISTATSESGEIFKVCSTCKKKISITNINKDLLAKVKRLNEPVLSGLPSANKDCNVCLGDGFDLSSGFFSLCSTDCLTCTFCNSKVSFSKTSPNSAYCRSCFQKWDYSELAKRVSSLLQQTKKKSSPSAMVPFRTQKARGIESLSKADISNTLFNKIHSVILTNSLDIKIVSKAWNKIVTSFATKKIFARPCPVRPRHGFVESRVISGPEELLSIWKEALAADSEAEVILMPFVAAQLSAVLIPESGYLALGQGHDGATSGKKGLVIPLVPQGKVDSSVAELRESAGISKVDHTYIEAVISGGGKVDENFMSSSQVVQLVQARSGPPITNGINCDYIPSKIEVTEIIQPTEDLLAWEELVQNIEKSGKTGIVAWKSGATLACHAAVHCVINKVPFVTSAKKPKIGSVLEPAADTATPVAMDWDRARAGFIFATVNKIDSAYSSLASSLAILHNMAALKTHPRWPEMFGWAIGSFFYYGALACIGESRHRAGSTSKGKNISRYATWQEYQDLSVGQLLERTRNNIAVFLDYTWGEGATCVYGGPKWSDCAARVVSTYNAFVDENEGLAISELNKLTNALHNGGPLFNKFGLVEATFAAAARHPCFWMLRHVSLIETILRSTKIPTVTKEAFPRLTTINIDELKVEAISSLSVRINIPLVWEDKGSSTMKSNICTRIIPWDESNAVTQLMKVYLQ